MENLKRLFVTISLSILLAGSAIAAEVNSPPCAPPDPAETNSPPCSGGQVTTDDPTNLTASISSEAEIVIIDTVMAALENLLTVY
jgi:hypothetical protein